MRCSCQLHLALPRARRSTAMAKAILCCSCRDLLGVIWRERTIGCTHACASPPLDPDGAWQRASHSRETSSACIACACARACGSWCVRGGLTAAPHLADPASACAETSPGGALRAGRSLPAAVKCPAARRPLPAEWRRRRRRCRRGQPTAPRATAPRRAARTRLPRQASRRARSARAASRALRCTSRRTASSARISADAPGVTASGNQTAEDSTGRARRDTQPPLLHLSNNEESHRRRSRIFCSSQAVHVSVRRR